MNILKKLLNHPVGYQETDSSGGTVYVTCIYCDADLLQTHGHNDGCLYQEIQKEHQNYRDQLARLYKCYRAAIKEQNLESLSHMKGQIAILQIILGKAEWD